MKLKKYHPVHIFRVIATFFQLSTTVEGVFYLKNTQNSKCRIEKVLNLKYDVICEDLR